MRARARFGVHVHACLRIIGATRLFTAIYSHIQPYTAIGSRRPNTSYLKCSLNTSLAFFVNNIIQLAHHCCAFKIVINTIDIFVQIIFHNYIRNYITFIIPYTRCQGSLKRCSSAILFMCSSPYIQIAIHGKMQ